MKNISIAIGGLGQQKNIVIFPDELEDFTAIIEVLQRELAPLSVWKECAVEFHRQFQDGSFREILGDIIYALESTEDIRDNYRGKPDYSEHMSDIYNCLAAQCLDEYSNATDNKTRDEHAMNLVSLLKKAEEHVRVYEYTWLIKGFYDLQQGIHQLSPGQQENTNRMFSQAHESFRRANESFKPIHDRAGKGKRKFLYGSLVGLGVVAYMQKNFQDALDYFSKAIYCCPDSNASIRVAIALSLFKLEQYTRAHDAADAALALDPTNVDALVIKGLLFQIDAMKGDKQKRAQYRMFAFENCTIAREIDPRCSVALIQLSNRAFLNWQTVYDATDSEYENSICQIADDKNSIIVTIYNSQIPRVGDIFRINGSSALISQINRVVEMEESSYTFYFESNEMVEYLNSMHRIVTIEYRDFNESIRTATQAIASSRSKEVTAEGHYLIGRVFHAQGHVDNALSLYMRSLSEYDFMLSAEGVAKIKLSRQEFQKAFEIWESIASKHPQDKDTKAYICLLKGICNKEFSSLDVLKEVVPGFQFEIDLWLLQAQLRLGNTAEYPNAVRCYKNALSIMQTSNLEIDPSLYSNLSVLLHSIGKLEEALTYIKLALHSPEDTSSVANFVSSDLEGIFYEWRPLCKVEYDEISSYFIISDSSINLRDFVAVNDDVVIGDLIYKVSSVDKNAIAATSSISIEHNNGWIFTSTDKSMADQIKLYDFKLKQKKGCFSATTTTMCYNLARILEDNGCSKAAVELYEYLIKLHPTFIECYLRLSEILREMGQFSKASDWLFLALSLEDDEPDVNLSLGDLHSRNKRPEDARKCFDKVCQKNKHDALAMISLGNFYYSTLNKNDERYQDNLKFCYKFYHSILLEDNKNMFAANGLGMVCAEKNEYQAAKEIFTRVREESLTMRIDSTVNLAHVNLAQGKYMDAEHLYQNAIKMLVSDRECSHDRMSVLYEWTAIAQAANSNQSDALYSLLNSVHLHPLCLRFWYNIGILNRDMASTKLKKKLRSVDDMECALLSVNTAKSLFFFLTRSKYCSNVTKRDYDRSLCDHFYKNCKTDEISKALEDSKRSAQITLDERIKNEDQHNLWKKEREVEMIQEAQRKEEELKSIKERAQLKQKQLEDMREKWTNVGASGKSKNKKRYSAGVPDVGDAENDDGDDDHDLSLPATNDLEGSTNDGDEFITSKRKTDEEASVITTMKKQKVEVHVDDLFGESDDS